MADDSLSELICALPPEITEIIFRVKVKAVIKERNISGWEEIHEELAEVPFCKKTQTKTNITKCCKCSGFYNRNNFCWKCFDKSSLHYMDYEDPPEEFKVYL